MTDDTTDRAGTDPDTIPDTRADETVDDSALDDSALDDSALDDTTLDVADLDRWMGRPLRPGELTEPVERNDIRRWVQAMHYPNPLHYDTTWAAESRFGELVAPQSFAVACDTSHGASPANIGRIPGSHLIFGGDDWWFFGPRIRPGDHLVCHRMPYDYRVTDTSFAGPTCFQRGDTLYINQRGERVALQRSTSIRYRVNKARSNKTFTRTSEPEWSDADLDSIEQRKGAFIEQIHRLGHAPRTHASVHVGDRTAEQILGPHSLASFTTEWRAFPMTVWGGMAKGPTTVSAAELGYTAEMAGFEGDRRVERMNPELTDGAYYGPSRGHLQPRWAAHVGMPRGYGYGASMGAWIINHVSGWAGEWGEIVEVTSQYRNPAFTGDITVITGEVTEAWVERRHHRVRVHVEMTNQDDATLAKADVVVELPGTEPTTDTGAPT
ncbi:MAG: MaoC family dehydratase N-terminal domain-containing protein [Actinobacteria bacterium]|nr:MaoC family dehydratase N-terminal domain-containing protein [Actinomycetota bacterium]